MQDSTMPPNSKRLALIIPFLVCACGGPESSRPEVLPSSAREIVSFASVNTTAQGGEVSEIIYSEIPDDADITAKVISQGVVMAVGHVGKGKGSKWGGIGLNIPIGVTNSKIDARGYRSITVKLASPTTGYLRLRLYGPEWDIISAGCYPIAVQAVTAKVTEYTIPFISFASENWCGAKSRSVMKTLSQLSAIEVVDNAIANKETRIVVGSMRLNP